VQGSLSPFTKIGQTAELAFLDTTSQGGGFEYEVTPAKD
jgi:hypothetical protein